MKGKRSIYICLILFTAVLSCRAGETSEKHDISVNGRVIHAELALTSDEREKGLMFRKSLDPDSGMLFIFPRDRKLSFWMKNTEIPLSIAYISSDGIIKAIKDMKPLSLKPVPSGSSVRYALEMEQGYFEKNMISAGDKVVFPESILQVLEKAED